MWRVGVDHPSSCGPVAIAGLHEAPHVDQRLATELELAIGVMWCAQDENVALRQDAIERHQIRIGLHIRIRGENPLGRHQEGFLELVAERRARVVDLRFERHAEQADGETLEIVLLPHVLHDVERQAFIDDDRGLPECEIVPRESGKLHRVLEQARSRGETGPGIFAARG